MGELYAGLRSMASYRLWKGQEVIRKASPVASTVEGSVTTWHCNAVGTPVKSVDYFGSKTPAVIDAG